MRGKDSTGSWRVPFNMFSLSHASSHGGDYTEGKMPGNILGMYNMMLRD